MTFAEVEQARKTYHDKSARAWIILLIIVLTTLLPILIPLISGHSFLPLSGLFAPFFLLVVGIIVITLITHKPREAYYKAYKAYFVATSLEKTFTHLTYDHAKPLPKEVLKSTSMINTGDRYHSNDLTIARYKDVALVQADAHIEVEHTDSEGRTTYSTIFRGRIMIFEFPKKFNFKLELIGHRFYVYKIPGKNPTTGRKMHRIETESTEFNQTFHIYGEDGFETFYILDPAIMVKIQAIAERYQGRLLLGFVENKLLIALNDGKDSFEPPKASKPIDEQTELLKVQSDIKIITDFIDELSLDRKLFV
ncbi:DUF3137 domain-containing protein [Candidatus Saccharibacteria bacterium]|nr:DUF3137 domain-containing protein [Candidatus Saccharibacteria bacterium]